MAAKRKQGDEEAPLYPDEQSHKSKRKAPEAWSEGEVAALYRGLFKVGFEYSKLVAAEPGLEGRDLRKVQNKLKQLAKSADETHGGDGKWVDQNPAKQDDGEA